MRWTPTASELTEIVALPVASIGALRRLAVPSLKVTVPDGVPPPPPEAATSAVKVTVWPKTLGLVELDKTVAVLLGFTTWVTPPVPEAEDGLKWASLP